MILLPTQLRFALRVNDIAHRAAVQDGKPEPDPAPVVKFFNPAGAATWLATELDADGDTLSTLCGAPHNAEIGAGWNRTGETSGRDYVSLSLAAPEFGPRKLYANLGRAAGQDDDDAYAVIWNPAD